LTNRYRIFVFPALLLILAGCAGVTTQPSAESAAQAQPEPVKSENRAVIALLDLARTDNEAGKREAAGASLERALRIEPRNPWLWHELAQLRLTQGQYEQSISLARKSNSFAGQDRRLQALNWRTISDARIAQGDLSGAEQALKQAAELEQSR
jgi:tetratricopeptide (TPR) repeat protein